MPKLLDIAYLVHDLAIRIPQIKNDKDLISKIRSVIDSLQNQGAGWTDERRTRISDKLQESWAQRKKYEIYTLSVRGEMPRRVHGLECLAEVTGKTKNTLRQYLSKGRGTFQTRIPSMDENTPYALCMVRRLPKDEAIAFLEEMEAEKAVEEAAPSKKKRSSKKKP